MKRKLLVFGACAIFLFTGCFSTNGNDGKRDVTDVKVKINKTENLSVESYFTDNDEIIYVVKNTGKEIIDYINIDVAFYNKKGDLIKTNKQYVRNLEAGKENVVKMSLTEITDEGKSELPNKIEVALNKTTYSTKFETTYTSKVEGKVEKTDKEGQLKLTLTNNSGVTVGELSAAIVFYKKSKPVNVEMVNIQSVEATTSQIVFVPTIVKNEQTAYVNYDEVKVVINNASTYNS